VPTLPEQEQLILGWVLTRAAAAEDKDAAEYTGQSEAGMPVATLMAEAAGFQDVGGYALPTSPTQRIFPRIWYFSWAG
jgi:hypothetical protein